MEDKRVGVSRGAVCLKARQLLRLFQPLMSPATHHLKYARVFKKLIPSFRVLLEKPTVSQ
jgi:hypothetical protein